MHHNLRRKFYFRAQDISISLPGADIAGKLVLVWKRGPRRTVTEPFTVKETLSSIDGSLSRMASTTQDLALICTMFKSRGGKFETKNASFSLLEETPEGKERKLGTCSIDLASYATPEKSSDAVELSFMEGNIRLKLTLSSHWLKSMGEVDDDEASVSSLGSFASSAGGGGLGHSGDDLDVSDLGAREATRRTDGDAPGNPFAERPRGAISGQSPGSGAAAAAAPACACSNPFGEGPSLPSAAAPAALAPAYASERERSEAARQAAVERRWDQAEGRAQQLEELQALREEIADAREARAKVRTAVSRPLLD